MWLGDGCEKDDVFVVGDDDVVRFFDGDCEECWVLDFDFSVDGYDGLFVDDVEDVFVDWVVFVLFGVEDLELVL